MAHVTQPQRKAHTAIYNLMTRVNNKEGGISASNNILKYTIWELCQRVHPCNAGAADRMCRATIAQCFEEE